MLFSLHFNSAKFMCCVSRVVCVLPDIRINHRYFGIVFDTGIISSTIDGSMLDCCLHFSSIRLSLSHYIGYIALSRVFEQINLLLPKGRHYFSEQKILGQTSLMS